jgi:rod shape-determining protein MreC
VSLGRRIREHRPAVILAVLVFLSLVSLATGTQAGMIRNSVQSFVSIVSHPFLVSLNGLKGGFGYVRALVLDYNDVRRENERLSMRVAELQLTVADRDELLAENQRIRTLLGFAEARPGMSLTPAGLVASAQVFERFEGMLRINRGSLHGITDSMCAITDKGVVGVVTRVDLVGAYIVTLNNPECKIGAMVLPKRVRGVVEGTSSDLTSLCTLKYVDLKDEIHKGDLVVTSPESVFPAGFPIGVIVNIDSRGTLWKTADIQPAVDPYKVDEVFIVQGAVPPPSELTGVAEEPIESHGLPLPDTRSLPARLAP